MSARWQGKSYANTSPCGTAAAYRRHRRHGEEPCEECREAERLRRRGGRPPHELQPCGTRAAYERHRLHGEQPCEECRKANSRATAARSAQPQSPRCKACGYLLTAPGHKTACGGAR